MRPVDPRLLRYSRAARKHLVVCVALGAAATVLVVAQAELLARGIADVVAGGRSLTAGSQLMVFLVVVLVARAVVSGLQDSASQRSAAVAKSELRHRLVEHVAALGASNHAPNRAVAATLATRGVDALDGYFGKYLPQLVLAVILPIVVVVRMGAADLTAAITVIATLPLIPLFMALVGRATQSANARRWMALELLSHHFLDVVSGLATLKIFGRAKAQADGVRRTTDRYRETTMATLRVAFLSSFVLELIATLSVALVAVGVGLRLVHGSLDLRTGLLVIILAPEAYLPLRQVGAHYPAAAEGVAAAETAFEILELPHAAHDTQTQVPDLRDGGAVEVHDLTVVHEGRAVAAPHRASLVAHRGEVVAVAGDSGAGKSTLLAVLLGNQRVDSGEVVICGGGGRVSLTSLDPVAWRTQLAWLDQVPFLFAGTVAQNVRLSLPTADDQQVREVLDRAGLSAMSTDRDVGEAGAHLSAGERRRVGMARVLLRDAPLVLLDEPTAGLDEQTERELLQTVRELARRSIVIMVTHRVEALAIADRTIVIGSSSVDTPWTTGAPR